MFELREGLGPVTGLDPVARVVSLEAHLEAPYQAWISTRAGGSSRGPYASQNLGLHVDDDPAAVISNRSSLASHLDQSLHDWVFANQTHGSNVAHVTSAERGRGTHSLANALDGIDAMVTTAAGVTLVLMVADCVPVLLTCTTMPIVAVVHAGWRGCASGVVPAAVQAMVDLGATPESLHGVIGPGIGRDRYVVGAEVTSAIEATGVDLDGLLDVDNGRHLDLTGVVGAQLTLSGLVRANIEETGYRTGEDTPFFSDRAARPCGRFALLARIAPMATTTGDLK